MAVTIGSVRIDENGKAHGGQAGEHTGREVSTQNWYLHSKGWRVFRAKYVPIPPERKEKLLPDRGGADEYVFHTEKGMPLPHATFKRMWHRLMLAAD